MKDLSLSDLRKRMPQIVTFLKRYAVFLFVVTFLSVYLYEVNAIGKLIEDEPSQSAVDSKLKPLSQLKIDEDSIKKITDLESRNIEVKSLFDSARQNPFLDCPSGVINSRNECVN